MTKLVFSTVSLLLLFFTFSVSSCKKPLLLSKGNLNFSKDTLVFDTVFTTIGSTTQQFKVYNNDSKVLNIEEVQLMGGENSPFRINFDGLKGTSFSDIQIEGDDSLFVFVEVTLQANGGLTPLIIEDSIRFKSNGKDQYVKLAVWGQDAYFHYLDDNEGTWANDKPHVIYGAAFVNPGKSLIIQAGTKIYMHKGSFLIVDKGSITIDGTLGNEVEIQGDRLEPSYANVSGQFYGIYLGEALPSKINYCNIKNGTAGIHVFSEDPSNPGYTLEITNSKITNCARYGLFLYSGGKIKAENCIFAKNEFHALFVLRGGDFNFNHCQLLGYGNGDTPAVGISNYYQDTVRPIDEGVITNSVIYGSLTQEIAIDTINPNQTFTFGFLFKNNLIRSEVVPTDAFFQNNIWNEDPVFISVEQNDFYFWSTSPMNNAADPTIPNTLPPAAGIGIKGAAYPRSLSTPDLGAYERI